MADPKIVYDIVANAEGGGEVDRLTASLEKLDHAIDPAAAARAQELTAELQRLGSQQTAIARFQELSAATEKAATDLAAADAAAAALRAEIDASGAATTAQAGRLEKLGAATLTARNELQAQTAALEASRGKLAALGIDATEAASAEKALGSATAAIRSELQALGTSLQGVNARALVEDLKQLGEQQQGIQQLRDLGAATDKARTALTAAEQALSAYNAKLESGTAPTTAQVNAQQRLAFAVDDARAKFTAQAAALEAAGAKLSALGVETGDLAAAEERLRTAAQGTLQEIQQLGAQQAAVQRFQELAAATERARTALAAADAGLQTFRTSITSAEGPTAAEVTELDRLSIAALSAQLAVQKQAQAQAEAGSALRQAGVDTDKLVSSQTQARTQMTATAAAAQQVAAGYRAEGTAATQSATQQVAANERAATSLESIKSSLNSIQGIGIAGILGSQTAQLLKGVAETADAYDNLRARIKLVTGDGPALQQAFEGVYQIAVRTNSTLESTGTLFSRIAQAGKEIGVSQADALKLTESINEAIQISGGSAESADAAITQLIQGLQSGVLRGDEFNSVMEQAPRLALALAAGLGVTTGELRKLSNEGELTSATVIRALQGQAAVLQGEFQTLPATVGRAVTNLRTEWERLVGTFNDSKGATSVVADGINKIAANLDTIARLAAEAGAALLAALAIKGAAALRALTAEASLSTLAMTALGTSISQIPTVVNITIAVAGFEEGYKIGESLRENFAIARTAGVALQALLQELVSGFQFLGQAAAALFTSDTVSAAFDRFKARSVTIRATLQDMYEEAQKSPEEVRRAAIAAADALAGVGTGAGAAGQQIQAAAASAANGYGGVTAAAGVAGAAVQQVGQGAATAGAQIASGGAAGALGLKPIVAGAKEAQTAILDLATAAKVQLPTVGLTAAEQATILADVAIKSRVAAGIIGTELPAAIAKLSGPGLEQFRIAFSGALEASISSSQRLGGSLQAAGKSGEAAFAAAQVKAALLQTVLAETGKRAAEAIGVDVASLATGLSVQFKSAEDNLAVLIRTMPALKAAGIDAAAAVEEAIGKMIDGAKSQAELDAILARLNALGSQGILGPAAVAGALKEAADKALALKAAIEDARPGIQSLGEAARKAGVDIGELTTGVSKSFRDSALDVTNLADQIQKSGVNAERAAPLLKAAIDQRIAAAQTKDELLLLAKALQEMSDKGQLAGINVGNALADIKAKADQISPALKQAQADAERLGVTLKDNVQGGATAGVNGAIVAYERLKESGKASSAELQAAFVTMANEAIAAAGGIVPEFVKVEAATRGALISVNEYGQAVVSASNIAMGAINQQVNAVQSLSSSWEAANAKAKEASASASAANDAASKSYNNARVDDSVKTDLETRYATQKLNADDLKLAQANFDAQKNNLTTMQANMSAYSFAGSQDAQQSYIKARNILDRAQELANASANPGVVPGKAKAPSPVPAAPSVGPSSVPSAGSTTHTVTVTLNGTPTTFNTASANDSDAVVQFLKTLESSARSAGY